MIRRPKRYAVAAKGTNLYVNVRTGNHVWRRRNETTGARIKRSTKTTNLTYALQLAARFEDEFQKKRAGLKVYDGWTKPLAPLAKEWTDSLRVRREETRKALDAQVTRALKLLKLETPADLDDIPKLERGLRALEAKGDGEGFSRLTLQRCFQRTLKQFAKWLAGNKRHLERDPLLGWEKLDLDGVERRERRAALPEEVARALLATDFLDRLYGRANSMRPVFTALLVSAARITALAELHVMHLDREKARLDLGPDVGNKRRGEATLDPTTLAELVEYVGKRKDGPLFLSANGNCLRKERVVDDWRESMSVAIVNEHWPDGVPCSGSDLVLVSRALLVGKVQVGRGGNPTKKFGDEKVRERAQLHSRISVIVGRLRPVWEERMRGIDVHGFRMTHETWAQAQGVHPILVDKQLGHSTPAGGAALDAARSLLASPTGRRHYLDMSIALIDAHRSAEAVRGMLDEALKSIVGGGQTKSAHLFGHRISDETLTSRPREAARTGFAS